MRLVFQIYLVGVLLAVIALGTFLVTVRALGPGPRALPPQLAVEVIATLKHRDDLGPTVARLNGYGLSISVRDPKGAHLGGATAVPSSGRTTTHTIPSGPYAGAVVTVFHPPPPTFTARLWITAAFVLVVLSFGTWGAARWLGRPLGRIAWTARAFGSGDLSARTGLERGDELGEVAHAFDEMAERIEGLLRTERELLANVSHELRTPLARIRTALDIAADDPGTAQAMLAEIDEDLGELQHIVDDVLTAARLDPEARRGGPLVPLRRAPTPIPELVDPAVARLCTAHPAVKVELDLPADLPPVEVDALLVRRVIGNVLENARRYGPADGPIVVRGSASGGQVHLEIEDRGMGIAPADLAKVFVPFFRAETSRTRDKGGIGLGLTLAKRIVDAHGGTIAIRSKVGEGTTVAIDLPAAA